MHKLLSGFFSPISVIYIDILHTIINSKSIYCSSRNKCYILKKLCTSSNTRHNSCNIISAFCLLMASLQWHLETADSKLCWYVFTLSAISSWHLLKTANEVQKFQCLGGLGIFTFLESSDGVQPSCHNSLALWRKQSSCITVVKY